MFNIKRNNKKLCDYYITNLINDEIETITTSIATPEKPTKKYVTADDSATILFTEKAWAKMISLLLMADKEVAWFGNVLRCKQGEYVIDDIYIYKQSVGSAIVEQTDEEMSEWLMNTTHPVKTMRFHGHSHVDFACFPSGTDSKTQQEFIDRLKVGDFYIFAILNKRNDRWFKIIECVDKDTYYVYENKNIIAESEGLMVRNLKKEYDENVSVKVYKAPVVVNKKATKFPTRQYDEFDDYYGYGIYGGYGGYSGYGGYGESYYDDYDYYGGYGGYGGKKNKKNKIETTTSDFGSIWNDVETTKKK